ncbi:MAG: galactose-6-phosphate isomerase subunit LacA [Aerococcus sp.]|nr:galactose-6-phosphate isomerase subunit LacA [Aerococcus sp.]
MKRVIIGSDQDGVTLKQHLIDYLKSEDHEVVDVTETPAEDFVELTNVIVDELNADEKAVAIAIDKYGVGSFMAASKHQGIVAAELSDERTAYMTRRHNNARLITMGQEIVGVELAKNIVKEFISADYDGGRHQVRVDMMNELC